VFIFFSYASIYSVVEPINFKNKIKILKDFYILSFLNEDFKFKNFMVKD
jgi:hypothetical protein